MIYTTYFAKLRQLPKDIHPIAICAKPPKGYSGEIYKALAPKYDFFSQWKLTKDDEVFTEKYITQVLNNLSPTQVVTDLYYLLEAAYCSCDIALVCYEKSTDFCHRHIVAEWLRSAGFECVEWT